MDYNSKVEELLKYHFPTDNKGNHIVHEEIRNSMHEVGEEEPEFTQKKLEAVFQFREKHQPLIDYLSRSYNFFSGSINLYFDDY